MLQKIKLPHPFLVFTVTGILLYVRALFFDYTNFDDNTLILDNQRYLSDISNIGDAFARTVFISGSDVFYRPLETIWFMLNAQLGGADLFVYHLTSMLLHVLAVCLVFILLKRLGSPVHSALFLSLLFLVHPMLTQAVAWVPGVVDILLVVFTVASFLFFLEFVRYRRRKHFVLHLLFFTCALFTKETAVGIIPVCLLYLLLIEREKILSYNQKVLSAGWISVSIVWVMMRSAALQGQQVQEIGSMISSAAFNSPAVIQYIGKTIFPFGLSVMPVMKDSTFLYGTAAVILLSIGIVLSKQKQKGRILFSAIWFIVFLLPTFISTSPFRAHQFYEHRMYLPILGILLFIAEMDWLKNFTLEKTRHRAAASAVVLLFFALTFMHESVFQDTRSFLDNAVATSPGSSLAHRNLGIYFQDKAEQEKELLKDAEKEYLQALALNPHEKDLHNNLGVIYDSWGNKEKAEKEYLAEVQLNPSNGQAPHNLGVWYAQRNENEKAEQYFKKALEVRPNTGTYRQLALLYKKTGRQQDLEKIMAMLQQGGSGNNEQAAPADPPSSDPLSLSRQLIQAGQYSGAEEVLKKALAQDTNNTKLLFNLGLVYYSEKKAAEAEILWRKVTRLDSTYTDAFNNLSICLAQQGKNKEAEVVLKKLVSSNPDYVEGYFNIANFYARTGRPRDALIYINELKKRGVGRKQFEDRGIVLSEELSKLFDAN